MKLPRSKLVEGRRGEIVLLAVLPLLGAATLTLAFAFTSRAPVNALLALFFGVSLVCAYVSLFIGVAPLLMLLIHRRWVRWYHFAAAGFFGVFLVWALPTVLLSGAPGALASLTWPSAVGAIGGVIFWSVSRRQGGAGA